MVMLRKPAPGRGTRVPRTSFFYRSKKRKGVKQKPENPYRSPCHRPPTLPLRKNRSEVQTYLFQSSVFDVELFGVDKVEQLPILLPVRGDAGE